MEYRPEWYQNYNFLKYTYPTGSKNCDNLHYRYPSGSKKKMIPVQCWCKSTTPTGKISKPEATMNKINPSSLDALVEFRSLSGKRN
jgi:hypothetical protein